MSVQTITPTFVVQIDQNTGQVTVYRVSSGNLSSANLSQLFSGQNDVAGAAKVIEAMIIRNLP